MPSGMSHKTQMRGMMDAANQGPGSIEKAITGGQKAPKLPKPQTSTQMAKEGIRVALTVMSFGAYGAIAKGAGAAMKASKVGQVAQKAMAIKAKVDRYKDPVGMATKRIGQEIGGIYARSSTKRALAAGGWQEKKPQVKPMGFDQKPQGYGQTLGALKKPKEFDE